MSGPESAAELVHRLLRDRGETLAVAESLTGGLLAATLVDVPGASLTVRGGLIVYATDLKASLAGVSATLLAERGPVDGDVASQLAEGAARRCGADWGLATTGVAGPEPQGGQQPGTVWVGVAGPAGSSATLLALAGTRSEIRQATVEHALSLFAGAVAAAAPVPAGPESGADEGC